VDPDGSEQLIVIGVPTDLADPDVFAPTPWESFAYDANDNAGRSHPASAERYRSHWNTPTSTEIDALGRPVTVVARNGPDPDSDWFVTRTTYDIQGNVIALTDALGREAFRYRYDVAGRRWRLDSIDAGRRDTIPDALGNPVEGRDSKGAFTISAFDVLHRPIRVWARDAAGGPATLRQRIDYGDGGDPDQPAADRDAARAHNLLGGVVAHYDEAGLATVTDVDFKGNVLDTARRIVADAPILAVYERAAADGWRVTPFRIEWQPAPGQTLAERAAELLDSDLYRTTTRFDALSRPVVQILPSDVEGRRRELRPVYNRAGGLEQVRLDDTLYVERIAYDAKGQRTLLAYANGVMTRFSHDPDTFRPTRMRSERYTGGGLTYRPTGQPIQDYGYDYDLAGNILTIRDRTPESGIPDNSDALTATDPALGRLLIGGNALNRRFTYDPIYRLTSATGRECDVPPDAPPWADQPRGTDLTRARAYTESYRYDALGNVLRLDHGGEPDGFARRFTVDPASNRLQRLRVGQNRYDYTFDANGNMTSETSSRHFDWNHADQLAAFRTQTDNAEPSVHAHYLYDAAGQRVKKVVRKQGGQVEITHYLGGFEHHRWGSPSNPTANNHVHVGDGRQRVALVRLGPAHPDDRNSAVQFHLGDHLGSSNVVVDDTGIQIRREEYTPYGETSFGSHTRKRYRFTGQERDEESGLAYEGARYFAAGLGRWLSCDPAGVAGGINLFAYAFCNPNRFVDPSGTQPTTQGPDGTAEAPGETIRVSGTAPPDVVGSAVKRGIINPLPTKERIAANLIAQDKKYDALAAQRHQILSQSDPEAAQAELDKRVDKAYGSIVSAAEADLEKTRRMSSSVMWFVGIALVGSALAAALAWAPPCLVVVGESSTVATAATGRFAAYTGAAMFRNWASGSDRDSAPVAAGTTEWVPPNYENQSWRRIAGYATQMSAERVGDIYHVTIEQLHGKGHHPLTGEALKGEGMGPFVDVLKAEARASGASTLQVTGTLIANEKLTKFSATHARLMGFPEFNRLGSIEFQMRTPLSTGRPTANITPTPRLPGARRR
jgi:RHS repeat-associated protein